MDLNEYRFYEKLILQKPTEKASADTNMLFGSQDPAEKVDLSKFRQDVLEQQFHHYLPESTPQQAIKFYHINQENQQVDSF